MALYERTEQEGAVTVSYAIDLKSGMVCSLYDTPSDARTPLSENHRYSIFIYSVHAPVDNVITFDFPTAKEAQEEWRKLTERLKWP